MGGSVASVTVQLSPGATGMLGTIPWALLLVVVAGGVSDRNAGVGAMGIGLQVTWMLNAGGWIGVDDPVASTNFLVTVKGGRQRSVLVTVTAMAPVVTSMG